jgi:hypothetical protein
VTFLPEKSIEVTKGFDGSLSDKKAYFQISII